MRSGSRVAATALLLAAALACGSDAPDDGRCEETLTFAITSGINPTFGWSPNCSIAQLRVTRDSDDAEIWSFLASSNAIRPPVAYGQVPVGANETNPPETLTFGAGYTLRIAILDSETGLLLVAGSEPFVP
ncbi:MAG TPA: hypothetical protein VK012_00920 [Gemmatimonadales bacterium]|nr:hypothetical protein [Gemmatimonadales bacterium]